MMIDWGVPPLPSYWQRGRAIRLTACRLLSLTRVCGWGDMYF